MAKYCYLCSLVLSQQMTWRKLLLKSFPEVICEKCRNKFDMTTVKEQSEDVALFTYNEAMKTYLHQYKFLQDVALAKVFSAIIHRTLSRQNVIIVPIPMHPKRECERTFAHVDELLKEADLPFVHILDKITTERQGAKSLQERLATPQLFRLKENVIVKPEHYMLVDDIRTTGITLSQAKQILLHNGAKKVSTFTLING